MKGVLEIKKRCMCGCGKLVPFGRKFTAGEECDRKIWNRAHPQEPMPPLIKDVWAT